MFALCIVSVCEISLFGLFGERSPRLESGPMLHIGFFVGTPGLVLGHECVFCADDFSFKKGGQGRVFLCEACVMLAIFHLD